MELSEATSLINYQNTLTSHPPTWADLGCGSGLFTLALAHLLKPESKIFAVDKNVSVLRKLQSPNNIHIEKLQADFISDELNIENLDGILMANSLHYVKDKITFIRKIEKSFKSKGCFLIVEYDMDKSNPWVPYPISFASLQPLFKKLGYSSIQKINELPSRYNRAKIYGGLVLKNA